MDSLNAASSKTQVSDVNRTSLGLGWTRRSQHGVPTAGRIKVTQATPKQKAMFFALAHNLGYSAERVKDRAKQRYGLASFIDITTEQLGELIDRLLELQTKREQANDTEDSNGDHDV